jgi:hypothetical protein
VVVMSVHRMGACSQQGECKEGEEEWGLRESACGK